MSEENTEEDLEDLEEYFEIQQIMKLVNTLLNPAAAILTNATRGNIAGSSINSQLRATSASTARISAASTTSMVSTPTSILTNPHFLSCYQSWHHQLCFMTNILQVQLTHCNFNQWNPSNVFNIQHEVFQRLHETPFATIVLFPKGSSLTEVEEHEIEVTWKSALNDVNHIPYHCYQSIFMHCSSIYQSLLLHHHMHQTITQIRNDIRQEFPELGYEWDLVFQILTPNEIFQPFDAFIQKYDLLQLLQE